MASDVLPDPDTPTTATVRHSGTSTSMSCRLLCLAPRTPMTVGRVAGTGISPAVIPGNLCGATARLSHSAVPRLTSIMSCSVSGVVLVPVGCHDREAAGGEGHRRRVTKRTACTGHDRHLNVHGISHVAWARP